MSKLDELKQEATDLGVSFSPNIGEAKLSAKIEEFKAAQESVSEVESVLDLVSTEEQEQIKGKAVVQELEKKAVAKKRTIRQRAKEAEAAARKTRVVEIQDNDPKVNAHTTTCSATCGNEYFDLGTIILPLNTAVEVAEGHIQSLRDCTFVHHQKDSKTGLSIPVIRRRYNITDVSNSI